MKVAAALSVLLAATAFAQNESRPRANAPRSNAIASWMVMAIAMTKTMKEPLIVNVDEGKDGERVQVFIG